MIYIEPLATAKIEESIVSFYPDRYVDGGQPAIYAVDEEGDPWAQITVNLSYYGMFPHRGWIFLDHDLMPYKDDIIKIIGTGEYKPVEYGLTSSIEIELKPEIAERLIGWRTEED